MILALICLILLIVAIAVPTYTGGRLCYYYCYDLSVQFWDPTSGSAVASQAFAVLGLISIKVFFIAMWIDLYQQRRWLAILNSCLISFAFICSIVVFAPWLPAKLQIGLILAIVSCSLLFVATVLTLIGYSKTSWATSYWALQTEGLERDINLEEGRSFGNTFRSGGGFGGSFAPVSAPSFDTFDYVDRMTGIVYTGAAPSGPAFEAAYSTLDSWFVATGTSASEQDALRSSGKISALLDVPLTPIEALAPELSHQTMNRWRYGIRKYKIKLDRRM